MSWGKEITCEACRAFYLFFATSLINLIIQEHECYIDVTHSVATNCDFCVVDEFKPFFTFL